MNRRNLLKWISRVIAGTCSAVVAVPGIGYVLAPLRRGRSAPAVVRRVIPLKNLRVGEPVLVALAGSRRDAWTHYARETIGRVWLVRRTGRRTPPDQAQVDAFSAICPHLGCSTQFDASRGRFVCPCHRAEFHLSGEAVDDEQLGFQNPAPRGLDSLPCRIVQEEPSGAWWVEVEYERFESGLSKKVPKV